MCTLIALNGIAPDSVLWTFNRKYSKAIYRIESVSDQLEWTRKVPMAKWDQYFTRLLDLIESNQCSGASMSAAQQFNKALQEGDLDSVAKHTQDAYRVVSGEDVISDHLIRARNHTLTASILRIMELQDRPFVALGAAHGGGPEGVVKLLTQQGIALRKFETVEQVTP